MELQDVLFEVEDGVGLITLNRPDALNAVSPAMGESIATILKESKGNPQVKVLVVTGAGRGFCAGGDVRGFAQRLEGQPQGAPGWSRPGSGPSPYITGFRNADQPIIAAINGPVAGVGTSLALGCDIRIASDRAFFVPAWILRGLIPDGGANWLWPRILGVSKAFEYLWTGERVPIQEAERLGLVSRVVPHDELMPTVMELANRLARGPSIAIALCKRAVYKGLESTLEETREFEGYAQAICFKTEDHAEGVRAFLEKREVRFVGR